MLVNDPAQFLEAMAALDASTGPATARAAFLLSPSGFALADESARDNAYMRMEQSADPLRALQQHAALAGALRQDCAVITFPGDPRTPDAVFPNNVFATARNTLVIGRMRHAVRRAEAERPDIRTFFGDVLGYDEVDLSGCEELVAELTGSLVIDRARNVGYCGLSERCDAAGAAAMHQAFGLDLTLCFELAEGEYHSNVLMSVLAGRAVMLAADGFRDPEVPRAIAEAFDHRVIWLTPEQKRAYAGNAITLGEHRVWMSATGAASLTPAQRADLERWGFAVGEVELDEIEKAGGSLRCCVAEIF
ncbi:arginine deiminase-related protein [Oleiagrimonas sp.]|jgi:hypothetical protein|uniref:arginine deiminase-related protein n=1 Tax=Oleiagrimonas sp. TaxID=2010330 RepID=UPI00262374AB|nr:arginine deiminase-related protein [Oleiagrimonas sp.]MDA3914965.1 arginine deiminase-related protein [Oleiagrimonas sp.]